MYTPRPAPQVPGVCQTAGVEFVHIEHDPALRRPNLVAAFRGWNDAGGAASLAAGYLRAVTDAERCAVIDSEPFIDYQQTRPTVQLVDGDVRRLDWPETEVYASEKSRPRGRRRHRAEHALAGVLGRHRRAGAGATGSIS